jgi:hypothetical protein
MAKAKEKVAPGKYRFESVRTKFTICRPDIVRQMMHGGNLVYQNIAQAPIEFTGGVFETEDTDLVEFLRSVPGYGTDFTESVKAEEIQGLILTAEQEQARREAEHAAMQVELAELRAQVGKLSETPPKTD